LTTQDCAAYCVDNFETGDGGIRYEEIVSLNTWQIQKLKPRITAAETKIASLELEISQLKSEIQNLKNAQNSAII
jgi:predicted RNase H-like nuclease (RuvC/YqgF family)